MGIRKLLNCVLVGCLLLVATTVRASHIIGGEVRYEYVSGTTYRIVLNLYGDCNLDPNSPYLRLATMEPVINIFQDSTVAYTNITLHRTATPPQDASPSCPTYRTKTRCYDVNSSVPGIIRYEYDGKITLPVGTPSSCWRFVFDGSNNINSAGRGTSITNITGSGNAATRFYIYSTLNNLAGITNTSPDFNVLATPYFCQSPNQQFNPGTTDADGDGLVYHLTDARDVDNSLVTYNGGYPAPARLATNGIPAFNTQTGQLSFSPNGQQYSTVVYEIEEFRNGIRIGSILRELNFVVIACNNTAPSATPANPVNATITNTTVINVCKGQTVSFNLNPTDAQSDTIDLAASGIPAGATYTISGNGTKMPSSAFVWNTTSAATGTYNFFVTYADRSCPISSRQTLGYTVIVNESAQIQYTTLTPATCSTQAVIRLVIPPNIVGNSIFILRNGLAVKTYPTTAGTVIDSLPGGTYTIRTGGNIGCNPDLSLDLAVPNAPFIDAGPDSVLCEGASAVLNATGTPTDNWNWSPAAGLSCTTCQSPVTNTRMTQAYTVSTVFPDGCKASDVVVVRVLTHTPVYVGRDTTICAGDTITLSAMGGESYLWAPAGSLDRPTNAEPRAFPETTTRYTVAIRENQCFSDTLSQRITVAPRLSVTVDEDFSAMSGATAILHAAITGATAITWSPTAGLSCTTCTDPTVVITNATYTATVSNALGCTASDAVRITATCDGSAYYVANTFTPNGDGKDDWFYPQGKGTNLITRFQVLNRWGQMVFQARNIQPNDQTTGWNGTYEGKPLDAGVYLYVLETFCADGTPVYLKGDVSLIR